MTPDRTIPPALKKIESLDIARAEKITLANGIPLFIMRSGTQEVMKIEIIFKAGRWYQPCPLAASFTSSLLAEGTERHSAIEIASVFDYYGAFTGYEAGYDNAYVALFTLNKHLPEVLPLMYEIIRNPVFPENEFSVCRQNRKQQFIVSNKKVVSVGQKKFMRMIFGNNHPYGTELSEEDFDGIQRNRIIEFHKLHYLPACCSIIVSGKIEDQAVDWVNRFFGSVEWVSVPYSNGKEHAIGTSREKKYFFEKEDALQSAVFIGKPLFTRTHPDFPGIVVVNTLLGGYFGSRLMQNIREDKGYTYGIHSTIMAALRGGVFFIESEVKSEFCTRAVDEIYRELKKLRTEPVPADELETVKNYMLGQFLRSVDGPFALADRFKILLESGLDYSYYDRYISTIKNITADDIMNIAAKYLDESSMTEVVVGKKQ